MLPYGIKVVFYYYLYDLTLLTILPGSAHINIMPRRNNTVTAVPDKTYKGIQTENERYLPKKLSCYCKKITASKNRYELKKCRMLIKTVDTNHAE
jgi:hypothetical protein